VEQARLAELKRFAKQLHQLDGEETRAAARAILLLAEEVESLILALAAVGDSRSDEAIAKAPFRG
jgi:hypothetical protein